MRVGMAKSCSLKHSYLCPPHVRKRPFLLLTSLFDPHSKGLRRAGLLSAIV